MDPAIFLDRDGTLVPDDGDAGNPEKVALAKDVGKALRALRDAGFRIVVATNQGGVARGRFTESDVERTNQRIAELVDAATGLRRTIEKFYYCPFHPKGTVAAYAREHPWRKPKPGMLLQAVQDMGLDPARSWVIGDSPRDIAAGRAIGARTVLVSRDPQAMAEAGAHHSAGSLVEAARLVLEAQGGGPNRESAATQGRADAAKPAGAARTSDAAKPAGAAPRKRRREDRATTRLRRERDSERLRRALGELTDEVRALRLRRSESGALRFAALGVQLVAILLATAAFLNLADETSFGRWIGAAVFAQAVTATLLLFDRR
ncbi:MAG: D-glycero-alpha-D-manno-heptose-1,7-bisphosphate 7-phosphatase [Phycisphaerales bacterium]